MEIQSVEAYKFYSNHSVQLLKRALVGLQNQYEQTKKEQQRNHFSSSSSRGGGGVGRIRERGYYSDDEMSDKSDDDDDEHNSGDDDINNTALDQDMQEMSLLSSSTTTTTINENSQKRPKQMKLSNKKKTTEEYAKQMGTPPSETLITEVQNETNTALALSIPNVLFPSSKDDDFSTSNFDDGMNGGDLKHFYQSREELEKNQDHLEPILSLYNLAYTLSSYNNPTTNISSSNSTSAEEGIAKGRQQKVFVILLHSGRFAAAIYNQGQCIKHTTFTRYTVRKGQGGSQSTMDNSKGKAKSVGSQLRRAGEIQLKNDVYSTMLNWKDDIDDCALYLLSLSKMLQKGFWEDVDKIFHKGTTSSNHGSSGVSIQRNQKQNWNGFKKGSDQVKSIPLDVGKPCFESCCAVYELLMTCSKLTVDLSAQHQQEEEEEAYPMDMSTNNNESSLYPIEENTTRKDEVVETVIEDYQGEPLTALHLAAKDGNIDLLTALIAERNGNHDDIDSTAGPKLMTPLHYAAESSSSSSSSSSNSNVDHATAAKCIQILLVQGHANPCMLDSHNRPPSYLATNDIVRNAFRLARAELGEDLWNWTEGAKVGPPLTNDDLKVKREKAAEKKRRQRKKQKERKALEQKQKAEEERREKEAEEKKEKEENARRVRAGLKPKAGGSKGQTLCDFCQKDCTGKRKSQLFTRLDFIYCSTDCMKKHQRELMAAAAMARMS